MSLYRIALVGFVQALLVSLYVWGVATIMTGAGSWFGQPEPVLAFIFVLMLFVTSALISGSIVLGYPVYLAFDKRFSQGVKVTGATAGWLFIFLVVISAAFILG
ncbi:MAG: hypothetical protein HYU86_06145 [Chloroflexi bacterium]|nr:hypothetical protein [Chloroflexota bacterium]